MTDSQDSMRHGRVSDSTDRVADLASRAIAELAAKRSSQRSLLSERLLSDFVAAALEPDEGPLQTAVTNLLHTGVPNDEIVDLYIPEAARHLGDRWCEDGLGFAEVTIGSARLQRLIRDLSTDPRDLPGTGQAESSILVVVREGEFHTLGAMVAASQLRRAGVSVRLMLCEPDTAVIRAIMQGSYDATLFSVGTAEKVAEFSGFVAKCRDAGSGGALIGLGGAVGHLGEEARTLTGVDFVGTDTREVVRQCGLKTSAKGARRRATSV